MPTTADIVNDLRRQLEQTRQTIDTLSRNFFQIYGAVQQADTSDLLRRVAREYRECVCVALGITAEPTCSRCGHRPCYCQ
jgi:hypothetical protein